MQGLLAMLHRRDLFMRLEFGVAALVVLVLVLASAFSRTVDAAEPTLLDAAERGDRAAVTRMLATGADPNAPGPDGTTAIMYAAANGDVELTRALIKAGANVKLQNQFGTSAITEAAIIGSAPIIDALLKAGADANTKNPEGETPLMAVARTGNVDAARLLVEARADVNARESFGGQTALMWAAAQSQPEMVKFLASKALHVGAYGFLTLLAAWLPVRRPYFWVAVGVLALHGCLTEYLQHAMGVGRTGKVSDVLIDWLGIALALAFLHLIRRPSSATPNPRA